MMDLQDFRRWGHLSDRRNIVASSNACAADARHDGGRKETCAAILLNGRIECAGIHRETLTLDGDAHQVSVQTTATRSAPSRSPATAPVSTSLAELGTYCGSAPCETEGQPSVVTQFPS